MPRFADLSFFTDREEEIYRLREQLNTQREVAEKLQVGDSAVASTISTIKCIRLDVLELMNILEESLDMSLITQGDLTRLLNTQTIIA